MRGTLLLRPVEARPDRTLCVARCPRGPLWPARIVRSRFRRRTFTRLNQTSASSAPELHQAPQLSQGHACRPARSESFPCQCVHPYQGAPPSREKPRTKILKGGAVLQSAPSPQFSIIKSQVGWASIWRAMAPIACYRQYFLLLVVLRPS